MFRTFDYFRPVDEELSLVLSLANRNVTTNLPSLSRDRSAYSNFAPSVYGSYYAEVLIYSKEASPPSLSGLCTIGFSLDADQAIYVGYSVGGWGYDPYTGNILNNNATLAATGVTATYGDIIGLSMLPEAGGVRMSWYKNGAEFYSVSGTDSPVLGVSVGSVTAGDLQLFLNCGQWAFASPLNNVPGWYVLELQPSLLKFATQDFIAPDTVGDPGGDNVYRGVIDPTQNDALVTTRLLSFWPFRANSSPVSQSVSEGTVTITDPEGDYDYLLTANVRDLPARVMVTEQGSLEPFTPLAQMLVDRVECHGDFFKTIVLKDNLALLDGMVQRRYFLPNTLDSASGRPVPISLGPCHTVSPTAYLENYYAIHDAAISEVGSVRVAGKLQVASVDYELTTDLRGVHFLTPPVGKISTDTSSATGSSAGLTDIFGGAGLFAGYSSPSDLAANWTVGHYPTNPSGHDPYWSSTDKLVHFETAEIQTGFDTSGYLIWPTPNVIRAGYSYLIKINIDFIPGVYPTAGYVQAGFWVGGPSAPYAWENGLIVWRNGNVYNSGAPQPYQGTITAVFSNTTPYDTDFRFFFTGSLEPGSEGKIASLELYELPVATSVSTLSSLKLADYIQEILQTRGGFPASFWNRGTAEGIDFASGYAGVGNHIEEPTSLRQALQPVLDSYCADIYRANDGRLAVARLTDPALGTPEGVIDSNVITGPVAAQAIEANTAVGAADESQIVVAQSVAPGLTTTIAGMVNYSPYTPGDFGTTDLTDCPNAIRNLLMRAYQLQAATGVQVAPVYAAQRLAGPLLSRLERAADINSEADRIADFFRVPRRFFFVPVFGRTNNGTAYDLSQVWTLVYPRYGLEAGLPVYILGIVANEFSNQLTLICIG
jgi:hypothetical protein